MQQTIQNIDNRHKEYKVGDFLQQLNSEPCCTGGIIDGEYCNRDDLTQNTGNKRKLDPLLLLAVCLGKRSNQTNGYERHRDNDDGI